MQGRSQGADLAPMGRSSPACVDPFRDSDAGTVGAFASVFVWGGVVGASGDLVFVILRVRAADS